MVIMSPSQKQGAYSTELIFSELFQLTLFCDSVISSLSEGSSKVSSPLHGYITLRMSLE